jgi:hypothetical protein
MKKLLLLMFFVFLLQSCKEVKEEKTYLKGDKNAPKIIDKLPKFKKGNIGYVKPDSLRVIITYVNKKGECQDVIDEENSYDIEYFIGSYKQGAQCVEEYNFH